MSAKMTWRGDAVTKAVREAGIAAILDGAEHILTESIDETPVLTGTLRRSGAVSPFNEREQAVYISYNTPYALRQHEELNYRHTDGKAKYLEDPFNRNKTKVLKLVAARVKAVLDKR